MFNTEEKDNERKIINVESKSSKNKKIISVKRFERKEEKEENLRSRNTELNFTKKSRRSNEKFY